MKLSQLGMEKSIWRTGYERGAENRLDENPTTETRAAAGKAMPETVKERISMLVGELNRREAQEAGD